MERNIKVFRAHRALSCLYAIAIALVVFVTATIPGWTPEPAV